jgi:hypothetical protein
MSIRLIFFLCLGVVPSMVHARLGETEGQSQARYGQPRDGLLGSADKELMPGSVEKAFGYQGWRVRAAFVNGTCVRIEYAHLPENNVPKQIAEQEISAILEAEKGTFSWKEEKATKQTGPAGDIEKALKGAFRVRKWNRSDRATADLAALGHVLKLHSRDADILAKKLAKENQEKGKQPPAANVPKF